MAKNKAGGPAAWGAGNGARKTDKITVGRVILGIVIGFILFTTIGLVFYSLNEIRERSSSTLYLPREETLYWNITSEKYHTALDNVRALESVNSKLDERSMECRAVARCILPPCS